MRDTGIPISEIGGVRANHFVEGVVFVARYRTVWHRAPESWRQKNHRLVRVKILHDRLPSPTKPLELVKDPHSGGGGRAGGGACNATV